MATPTSSMFKQIDVALAQYYQHLNVANYSDFNNVGLFINYIKKEELDDPQLPIEEELGANCDPYNCTYTGIWINSSINFPIPSYAQIPHNETEAFIFYILQYCYKYNKPPSDDYLQTVLIPQCNGTIISLPPQNNNRNNIYVYSNKAFCPCEDNFPTPFEDNVYQITVRISISSILVKFYVGCICDCIINCVQLYLFGEEGAMCTCCIVSNDQLVIDDHSIAHIDNGERLTATSFYAIRYYANVSKNRRDFCMEMKRYYKASYGKIVKIFEELENIFASNS